MKKHLLTVLLAASCSTWVQAQSLPPGRTEKMYVFTDEGIAGSLEMDTMQRRQLQTVEVRYQRDLDALRNNDTISEAAAKAEADRIAAVRHKGMKTVLTPEQYEKWVRIIADAEVK